MRTFLIILFTALVTAMLTFTVTKNCMKSGAHSRSQIGEHHHPFYTVGANPYPAAQAAADIDSFQRYLDSVYCIFLRDTEKRSCNFPKGFFQGLVGYTINSGDLINALGIYYDSSCGADTIRATYEAARVYLGFSVLKDSFKLFVIPVSYKNAPCVCSGKDLLFRETSSGGVYVDPSEHPDINKDVVLDLISPCPTICDTSSPLIDTVCVWLGIKCNSRNNNVHASK